MRCGYGLPVESAKVDPLWIVLRQDAKGAKSWFVCEFLSLLFQRDSGRPFHCLSERLKQLFPRLPLLLLLDGLYEHAFAMDWNAMKGYHYLMRIAHLFNTLARFARHLKALYAELGVRGTLAFIRQSCAAPWLDPERIRALLSQPFQLYLE